MIIDNREAKQELLYTAYGFSVYGIVANYQWTYDGSGRTEKCLTRIIFTDSDNKELCNKYLGNNIIFMHVFDKNIDNILWHLNREKVDSWQLDHDIIQKVLVENCCFFSHRIEQRKQKEKQEEENRKRITEREVIQNEKKEEIKEYCNKKKLYCKFDYNNLYVFKIRQNVEKVEEMLNKADSRLLELYINYANNHPNNELQFVYAGYYKELDQMLTELKEIA
jgi:hypothetical protein